MISSRPAPHELPELICTVDVVLLTLKSTQLHVLLSQRKNPPYQGVFAVPGGYIHAQEDQGTVDAAERVLRTKLGLTVPYLEQLGAFSGPGRDPRGWSVSVAYYALLSESALGGGELVYDVTKRNASGLRPDASASTQAWQLFPAAELPSLPFDHRDIVQTAVQRLRNKSSYSSLPIYLCPPEFTLPELQRTYEAVLGESLNKVSFRRKLKEMGILEELPEQRRGAKHRPAQLYRLAPRFRKGLSLVERALNSG